MQLLWQMFYYFTNKIKSNEKPILKGAYVEESVYIGDDQVKVLSAIKSKEEVIGDIIGLLQSPAKNVISGLKGGGSKLSGILKALENIFSRTGIKRGN